MRLPHFTRAAAWVWFLLATPSFPIHAAAPPSVPAVTTTPAATPERLHWWREGRFGIFIHWGPVSLKGTEISWSRANSNPACPNKGDIPVEIYDTLYREFNPTRYDANAWVALAQAAGARYMVLTAKHCDGFLLWPSKVSDYNISQSPFRRDICGELVTAARARGMRLGWYFSPMDWRDPDFRTARNNQFLPRMQGELREVLGNYGPIDLLWFDWDGREAVYDQARTYALVKELQPRIVINNRLDLGPKDSDRVLLSPHADYYTPEQSVGAYDDQRPWESCMTLSRRNQWAWGGTNDGVKPFRACLEMLVRCAGGDGNLLLNVGPTPTGEIAPEQAERLRQLGDWLTRYGESIYGTRGGPFKPGRYGASTRKDRTLYLHLIAGSTLPLRLPAIPARVVGSRLLTGGVPVVRATPDALEIDVAEKDRAPIDTVVALELDRPALELAAVEVPAPRRLTAGARAKASNVFQNQPEFGADRALDGDPDTRWATDGGTTAAWLELDLGHPATFTRAHLAEAFPERIRRFELQRWDGTEWKPFVTGTTVGESWSRTFPAVTAQRIRLNILAADDGPTLWEFDVFE